MDKKRISIIVVIIGIILTIALVVYFALAGNDKTTGNIQNENTEQQNLVQIMDDNTKVNISEKLATTKKVDGLEVTNLKLTESGNITQLLGTITNTTNKEKEECILKVTFIDREGKEMTSMNAYIKDLKPGESTQLSASTTFDYSNAYDFKLTKE